MFTFLTTTATCLLQIDRRWCQGMLIRCSQRTCSLQDVRVGSTGTRLHVFGAKIWNSAILSTLETLFWRRPRVDRRMPLTCSFGSQAPRAVALCWLTTLRVG